MHEIILAASVCLVAGAVQGCTGFGSALVAVPILSLFVDVKIAVVVSSLMGLAINAVLSVQLRAFLSKERILPLFAGAVPGAVLGALFLRNVNEAAILALLGAGLLAYSSYGLFARPLVIRITPLRSAFVGLLTGAASAAISAGGPPAVVYVSLSGLAKDQVKATLTGFFAMTGSLVVMGHALGGLTTVHAQTLALFCLPATLAGVALGIRAYGRMSQEGYRKALFVLLAALGVMMLARSF